MSDQTLNSFYSICMHIMWMHLCVLVCACVCECLFQRFSGANHVKSNGVVLNIRQIQSLSVSAKPSSCFPLSPTFLLKLTSYFDFRIFPIQIWFGISIWNHILAKNPAFPVHFEQYLTPLYQFISHCISPNYRCHHHQHQHHHHYRRRRRRHQHILYVSCTNTTKCI